MSDNLQVTYYDTHEAARVMRLSPATLKKWRQQGSGPIYSKLNGKVLYTGSDIREFIIDRRVKSTAANRH